MRRGFVVVVLVFFTIEQILDQRSGTLSDLLKGVQVVSDKVDILIQEFSLYYFDTYSYSVFHVV